MRLLAVALVALLVAPVAAGLAPELDRALRESRYVYIQSERASGALGSPAEIWFFWDGEAVWVGTRPTSWRVRRIRAGRTRAHIAVGTQDGPSFEASGSERRDPAMAARLMKAFAEKYPERWPKYAESFREGFEAGDRVLVRYAPTAR